MLTVDMREERHREKMDISMFGLGYVGCVGAACLADMGHRVIGNDISENKVNLINQGKPTIIEAEIGELVKKAHDRGLLEATMDPQYAVSQSEISFIVVGTPSTREGHLNLDYILKLPARSEKRSGIKTASILWPSAVRFFRERIKKWGTSLSSPQERNETKILPLCLILNFCGKELPYRITRIRL